MNPIDIASQIARNSEPIGDLAYAVKTIAVGNLPPSSSLADSIWHAWLDLIAAQD